MIFNNLITSDDLDNLKLCQVDWGPSVDSHLQVSPKMSDWFQVSALAGPVEDIHRVVPKPLLHSLGCGRRVIVMLKCELSAQTKVLSALNQVLIKDISVFSCIQLSIFSHHFLSPCRWNTPPLQDTATTMLHCCDGIMQVISGVWFPSDIYKELRFIRPENIFFFIVWELFRCSFVNSNQGFMYLYWGEGNFAIKPRLMECRSDVCPFASFSHLHIRSWSSNRVTISVLITSLTKTLLFRLLSLARRLDLGRVLIVSNFIQ